MVLGSVAPLCSIRDTKRNRNRTASGRSRTVTQALVNVDFGPAMILGSGLVASGLALYQVRVVRPEVSKDYDIMFASVALLCGGILIFQGWRLDPLLLFGQILTAFAAVTFAAEAVKLRGQVSEELQAQVERERRQQGGGSSLPGQERMSPQQQQQQQQYRDDYDARYDSADPYYSYSSAGANQGEANSRYGNAPSSSSSAYDAGDRYSNAPQAGRRGGDSYMEFETQSQYEGDDFFFEEGSDFGEEDQDFNVYDVNSDWD